MNAKKPRKAAKTLQRTVLQTVLLLITAALCACAAAGTAVNTESLPALTTAKTPGAPTEQAETTEPTTLTTPTEPADRTEPSTPTEPTAPVLDCRTEGDGGTLAVWWWNASTATGKAQREKYLGFLAQNGVNRIYLCMPDTRFEYLPAFVSAAAERGIKVCLLAGDASYVEPGHGGFARLLAAYLDYQENAEENAKLAALHLDVEAHQFEDYEQRKDEYLQLYADFVVKTAQTLHENGEKLELDVPFWYDGFFVKEGEKEVELLDLLARSADALCIMSYRDSAKEILALCEREIELCRTYGKTLICGVESSSDEAPYVSFKEEGRERMYEAIAEVYARLTEDLPQSGSGAAIHYLDSWYKLKD